MIFKSASSNLRATSSNPRVISSDPRIIKSVKTQVNSLKSSSFHKIISPELFNNSWGSSVSGDNLLFYVPATPCLRLQQEAEWVNINFERIDISSPQKIYPPPNNFGEICFFLWFYFKKTKCDRFFFHFFNTKHCAVPLNYYFQALYVSPHLINSGLSDNGCLSVLLASASSPPW